MNGRASNSTGKSPLSDFDNPLAEVPVVYAELGGLPIVRLRQGERRDFSEPVFDPSDALRLPLGRELPAPLP